MPRLFPALALLAVLAGCASNPAAAPPAPATTAAADPAAAEQSRQLNAVLEDQQLQVDICRKLLAGDDRKLVENSVIVTKHVQRPEAAEYVDATVAEKCPGAA
jgi:hypothetical protein